MATTICKQLPQYDIVQQLLQSENLLMIDNIQDILNPLISIWAVAQKEDDFYYSQVNKFSPSPWLSLARITFMLANLVKPLRLPKTKMLITSRKNSSTCCLCTAHQCMRMRQHFSFSARDDRTSLPNHLASLFGSCSHFVLLQHQKKTPQFTTTLLTPQQLPSSTTTTRNSTLGQ